MWLPFLPIVALYACRGDNTPSSSTAVSEAARGLPQRLVPADFGTPTYKPPRNSCALALRDQARPSVQLTLVSWTTRIELAPFRWSLHLCVRGGFPDAPSSRCLSGGLS
jgi:hypothetical protein